MKEVPCFSNSAPKNVLIINEGASKMPAENLASSAGNILDKTGQKSVLGFTLGSHCLFSYTV